MLSKSEIELLSNIGRKPNQSVPVHEIANRLDWSDSHASRVITKLQERDFVRTERKGGKRLVSVTDIQPVEQLSTLTSEFDHVNFQDLISGSVLVVLYYLNVSRTATELAELSHLSRNTVYRRLNSLQKVGIVGKDRTQYQLTEPFSSLSELARSISHHEHRQEALNLTEGVNIIWETHDEYLFSCEAEFAANGFHQTGPSVFEGVGIPLLTRARFHYFRSEQLSRLTATDLVCHTLLIDDSTRYRTYCLLLIKGQNVDQSTLRERAAYYNAEAKIDLETLIEGLFSYLETEGDATNEMLPKWEDFKRTASDYNISV